MSQVKISETETVIKKILPYLKRRGYNIDTDMSFEQPTADDGISKGYIDILVSIDKKKCFVIEAKKISKKLDKKDKTQALRYAKSEGVPFAVLTNGVNVYCFNTVTKNRITFDGKMNDKLPSKAEMPKVLRQFKTNKKLEDIALQDKLSLPYRQGLSLRQLNLIFEKCHNIIRKIEKYEQDAFEDFSKLLFLKLLEEKAENEIGRPNAFMLPYSYRFYELAKRPKVEADQVKTAIEKMIADIKSIHKYSDVLGDGIGLKNPNSYYEIVKVLDTISFIDCSTDVKGAAFEYYVRATLKGKKLGQYFTPRNLVRLMYSIVGEAKIYDTIKNCETDKPFRVLDPACGTAGFLVYMLQRNLSMLDSEFVVNRLTIERYNTIRNRIKEQTFYGSDANAAVAAAAKMNMIIAGDGQTNIKNENSLAISAHNWNIDRADIDLIMTNPPFGTSEEGSLSEKDMEKFTMPSSKGQVLFLEKMIKATKPGGEIFTVIDQGIINTESNRAIRELILAKCKIRAIIGLPSETFKPNKINVRSSLLYLTRKTSEEEAIDDDYTFALVKLNTLGFDPSGNDLRGFDFKKMTDDITTHIFDESLKSYGEENDLWLLRRINVSDIYAAYSLRFDYKFLNPDTRKLIEVIHAKGGQTVKEINTIMTLRGKSPDMDQYVDESDGYAVVLKAANVTRFGTVEISGSDWIEKATYEEYETLPTSDNIIVKKYDILVVSTGDGSLGKAGVYDLNTPAIVDGHVAIIRIDRKNIDPYYVADYLRKGAGAVQINRAYTGATGMIELTPAQLETVVIDTLNGDINEQRKLSKQLRKAERQAQQHISKAEEIIKQTKHLMYGADAERI